MKTNVFLDVRILVGVATPGRLVLSVELVGPSDREDPAPPVSRRTAFEITDEAELRRLVADTRKDIEQAVDGASVSPLVRVWIDGDPITLDRTWEQLLGEIWSNAVIVVRRHLYAYWALPVLELPLRIATWGPPPTVDAFTKGVEGVGWRQTSLENPGEPPHIIELDARAQDRRALLGGLATPALLLIVLLDRGDPTITAEAIRRYPYVPSASILTIHAASVQATTFLNETYRKLMHDVPLDEAVAMGIAEARLSTADVRLDMPLDGQDSLRLSHAAVASVGGVPKPSPAGTAANVALAVEVATAPSSLHRELRSEISASARPLDTRRTQIVSRATSIDFSQEDHGVRQAAQLQLEARDLRRQYDQLGTVAIAVDRAFGRPGAVDAQRRYLNLRVRGDDPRFTFGSGYGFQVGQTYILGLAIKRAIVAGAAAAPLDDALIARFFAERESIDVGVAFFAEPDDAEIGPRVHRLRLTRWGDSDEVTSRITPRRAGVARVRGAIFYRGQLLQSVVLRMAVVEQGQKPSAELLELVGSTPTTMDYAVATDFAELEQMSAPGLTLVLNDAESTHWIGVFTKDGQPVAGLKTGQSFAASDETYDARAGEIRKVLSTIEGLEPVGSYNFTASDQDLAKRAALLVTLAREGRQLYASLFENGIIGTGPPSDQLQRLKKATQQENQVLSIARCREATTIPWAAAYDLYIDPFEPNLTTCQVFVDQLVAGTSLVDRPDLCSQQASCPLKGSNAQRTVCPFGFWGFRHEIEQPLGRVMLQPDGTVRPANVVTRIAWDGAKPLTSVGAWKFDELDTHLTALAGDVAVDGPRKSRDDVLQMLARGSASIYYFFCHGDLVGQFLQLRVGNDGAVGVVAPASIDVSDPATMGTWRERSPLVFFNGCRTVAFEEHALSEFVARFQLLGASGVIGTEISVFAELATTAAESLLAKLARGERMGAALLGMRRDLLRRLNPLGLVFVAYASSALHLHKPGCTSCTTGT